MSLLRLRQHVAGAQAANAFGIGINDNTTASIAMRLSSNMCERGLLKVIVVDVQVNLHKQIARANDDCVRFRRRYSLRYFRSAITKSSVGLCSKPLKVYEIMRRANIAKEEACQALLLKMRDEGSVKFDIHSGRWIIG
jgi:hypothetical protein